MVADHQGGGHQGRVNLSHCANGHPMSSALGHSRRRRALLMIAVGTRVTSRPPHRTVRAQFGHTACMGLSFSSVHHTIFSCFVTPFFCSTRAASILPPRPQISATVARSGGQGRRFFSAAEGLSLTDASTAAGYPRSGGRQRNDPRGACIGREQSRERRLYSVEPT